MDGILIPMSKFNVGCGLKMANRTSPNTKDTKHINHQKKASAFHTIAFNSISNTKAKSRIRIKLDQDNR
jgi:hypothetical protein